MTARRSGAASAPADSLRELLLRWLVVPLVAVLAVGGFAAYTMSVRIASEAYDSALLDPALAIAERLRLAGDHVELDLPTGLFEALRVDTVDRMYFAVRHGDLLMGGDRGSCLRRRSGRTPGAPVLYDTTVRGTPVRAAAIAVGSPVGETLVLVAETLKKREALARQALLASTLPEVLVALFAVLVVWFGVRRGLAPLELLRAEIGARSHRDLRPVDESHAPAEVRPLVNELNDLLARLRTTLDAQGRFIADAAHQLRTPLAALQAQLEAARRETGRAEREAALERLDAATRRTARLASQLLVLARVEPSGEAVVAEPTDFAAIAGAHVDEWLQRADARRIDLGFDLAQRGCAASPHCWASSRPTSSRTHLPIRPRGARSPCERAKPPARRSSRSRTTDRAFPRRSGRACSSASIASRARRPAARDSASRSCAKSRNATVPWWTSIRVRADAAPACARGFPRTRRSGPS